MTLLCLHLLGEREKAKQVIDMGVEYETAHLKFSGSVTNSLGKIFELTTIEKSCDCLGTVQVLNKNRTIPEVGVITLSINVNTLGKEGQQSHQLLLRGKDAAKEQVVLPVFVEGFVVPAIQAPDAVLAMKSYAQFADASETHLIRILLDEPIQISYEGDKLQYSLSRRKSEILNVKFGAENANASHKHNWIRKLIV